MKNKASLVIEEFLKSWLKGDYTNMYELTNKTWSSKHTKKQLKKLIPNRIKSYKIEAIDEFSECIYDVKITLRISGNTKKVNARMLCEIDAFKPSIEGEFGVNPISIINKLY